MNLKMDAKYDVDQGNEAMFNDFNEKIQLTLSFQLNNQVIPRFSFYELNEEKT